jgi:hypothetical protein
MTLLPASEEFLSKFPSSRYLSSSGSNPLGLSGVGDPAGSNATAGLALRVTGNHKPLHHDNRRDYRAKMLGPLQGSGFKICVKKTLKTGIALLAQGWGKEGGSVILSSER